ncbi:MAG: FHA domain-containing protein [Planctomycetaceae bacterium]|nr:FHA domain-containing protein [Planctomycetaceae bacterium]
MNARFVIVSPASQKRAITVRLPILVGRSEDAKFRIQQDSVSRRHCEFFTMDDAVFVRDLESTNGTFLDDEEIAASTATAVPSGTVVRVGGVAFRVEYESAVSRPASLPGDDTVPLPSPALAADADADESAPTDQHDTGFAGLTPVDASPAAEVDWPSADAASPPAADDDNLNDFFKSLS